MWLMTQGSRQLPASPVPKALLTSQPSRALWVRAAPQVPTCLMLAGCPQVCGPLMSPDTVQCPLRWGGEAQHQPREGDSGLWEGGHTGSPDGARGREGRTQAGRARGHCIPGHRTLLPALWGGCQDTAEGRDMKPTCAAPAASEAPDSPHA